MRKRNGLPRAASIVRETPEKRRLRVAQLQAQVQNGTYRPDLAAVAQRLAIELRGESALH